MVMKEGEGEEGGEVRFCSLLNDSNTIRGTVVNDSLVFCYKILKTITENIFSKKNLFDPKMAKNRYFGLKCSKSETSQVTVHNYSWPKTHFFVQK